METRNPPTPLAHTTKLISPFIENNEHSTQHFRSHSSKAEPPRTAYLEFFFNFHYSRVFHTLCLIEFHFTIVLYAQSSCCCFLLRYYRAQNSSAVCFLCEKVNHYEKCGVTLQWVLNTMFHIHTQFWGCSTMPPPISNLYKIVRLATLWHFIGVSNSSSWNNWKIYTFLCTLEVDIFEIM